MEELRKNKLERAKKRVDEIKGFYLNTDSFWQWGHFVTLFFWGIGLFFHGAKVFGFNPLFSKSWEERQIQKYIDKDRDNAGKYL